MSLRRLLLSSLILVFILIGVSYVILATPAYFLSQYRAGAERYFGERALARALALDSAAFAAISANAPIDMPKCSSLLASIATSSHVISDDKNWPLGLVARNLAKQLQADVTRADETFRRYEAEPDATNLQAVQQAATTLHLRSRNLLVAIAMPGSTEQEVVFVAGTAQEMSESTGTLATSLRGPPNASTSDYLGTIISRAQTAAQVGFLLSLVTAVLLTLWVCRRVLVATHRLRSGVVEFGQGDLNVRLPPLPIAELTDIGNEFNNMAERLGTAQTELKKQQELSESLLLNVLPTEVANELKAKGAVDPRYHEDVTILFTDFQGFTLSTEKLPAEELVKALNHYFTAFDNVVQGYGLEKLKTIGDSYMAVAGLPERRASHAVDAVLAAFDIVDEVLKAHARGLPAWSIRVGVHTGPVVSGVVGIRKFAFDIWGESVNFASRMESSGAPNRVNLSASTYTRVKDFFECEYRGKVPTKEGREFEMYFAVGPLAGLRQSGDVSEAFKTRYKTYFQRELTMLPASITGKVAAGTGA